DRGVVAAGSLADLVLVDPAAVADRATYEDPLALATGIEDVLVSGRHVLAGGRLTGEMPGRGLRIAPRPPAPAGAAAPRSDGAPRAIPSARQGPAPAASPHHPSRRGDS